LRQFHLKLAFAGVGALGKNVENQARAVDNLGFGDFFDVGLLGGS
jgi:hypothetical protein